MVQKILITPIQKFVRIESFSGILLFGATLLALIIANSLMGDSFKLLWQYEIGISTSGFELIKPLKLWINDGLMAIFFFLIGLEIKRELLIGELNTLKKAAFPFFAAIGGMLIPVLFFLILNRDPESSHAWGIPMATDIAFSLAILRLLGKRIPLGIKVFLIAFAIVDDLGAVLVIALFYSGEIRWLLIITALLLLATLYFVSSRKYYSRYITLVTGLVIWFLFLKAGIHPTIAGILLAFTVPIRQRINTAMYIDKLHDIVHNIRDSADHKSPLLSREQIEEIDNLEDWTEKFQSPLQHLEHKLHNWVAFFIMPVFAFSNSGVDFNTGVELDLTLARNIALSLVMGKLVGITALSWISIKLRLAELPSGVNFRQIAGIALLAGVGFTMSIFVANLAFNDASVLLDSAKAGILAGSLIAAVLGYLVLRLAKEGS